MTIAINCWILRNKRLDGIGYFTIFSLTNLIKKHPDMRFRMLCDRGFNENYFNFPNVQIVRLFPALRHPVLYFFYNEFVLPLYFLFFKADLYLSMDGFLSLATAVKQLPIIYDINFEHRPKDIKFFNRIYYTIFFKRFAKKAVRIATISEYSKNDIVNHYGISVDKIDNVSCGINSNFSPLSQLEITATKNRLTDGKPFFFFVGSMHPRKNIQRLIESYTLFRQKYNSDIKLVLAGSILWSRSQMENTYLQSPFKEDIIFTGRLTDDELRLVLGSSYALTFVPIFEGFGLPIVEAFQSHVPVICSNVTSMPEVAGDAAIMVDPYDCNSIADGMASLFLFPEKRVYLVKKGIDQAKLFNWERTADLLWDCIQKAVN